MSSTDSETTKAKAAAKGAPAETAAEAPAAAASDAAEPAPAATPELDAAELAEALVGRDERIQILEIELASTKDKLMRAAADVQNTAKRAERDRRDAEAYGGAKLARDLLPVYDNLDSALKLATDELRETASGFFNGVELTRKEILAAFAKHKIAPIEPAIGDRFDPNRHEAMFEAPTPDAEPGAVIQVIQSGFMISDRLLRPAMVGVARAADGAATHADGAGDASET